MRGFQRRDNFCGFVHRNRNRQLCCARDHLTQEEIDAGRDPVARFVGLKAYAQAGGGVRRDLGLAVRTCFVFIFVLMFAAAVVPIQEARTLTGSNLLWLGLSGVTTAFSWVFYYKAINIGEVSTVALIDKGSVVVALVLAVWILHEALTPAKLIGGGLIVAGLVVIARGCRCPTSRAYCCCTEGVVCQLALAQRRSCRSRGSRARTGLELVQVPHTVGPRISL